MKPTIDLMIDEEFRNRLPPADAVSDLALLTSLKKDNGPQDSLKVWAGTNTIIDGHRRHKLCLVHGWEFRVDEVELDDRESVLRWIDQRCAANRTLNKFERSELIARLVDNIADGGSVEAAVTEVSKQLGISERQTYRLKRQGDAISTLPDKIRCMIESGSIVSTPESVSKLAKMTTAERLAITKLLTSKKTDSLVEAIKKRKAANERRRIANRKKEALEQRAAPVDTKSKKEISVTEAEVVDKLVETTIKRLGELRRSFDSLLEFLGPSTEFTNCQKRLDGLSSYLESQRL